MDSSGMTQKAMNNEALNFSRIESFCDWSEFTIVICNKKLFQGYMYQDRLQTYKSLKIVWIKNQTFKSLSLTSM